MTYTKQNKFSKNPVNDISEIDYKNIDLLKKFLTDAGKIIPGRVTGVSSKAQRKITEEIKLARYLSLIPYCDHHK